MCSVLPCVSYCEISQHCKDSQQISPITNPKTFFKLRNLLISMSSSSNRNIQGHAESCVKYCTNHPLKSPFDKAAPTKQTQTRRGSSASIIHTVVKASFNCTSKMEEPFFECGISWRAAFIYSRPASRQAFSTPRSCEVAGIVVGNESSWCSI